MRLSPAAVLLVLTPALAAAQRTPPMLASDGRSTFVALERPVLLDRPTVLVLLPLSEEPFRAGELDRAQATADSFITALRPTADSFGYIIEVRSTGFLGILDFHNGASYEASPQRGPGVHLLRPGFRPSILHPMLSPSALAEAIRDYARLVRPVPL